MKKENKIIQFGEDVEGYDVPVLNEREIRAAAGILFVCMLVSLMFALFRQDFLIIKYVIFVFFSDLLIRVFISPRFSPFLIVGRFIVSNQVPEYVGSAQKKFAWKIGIGISGLMLFLLVIINSTSIITVMCCFICLVFLFFEASFGICLGCIAYSFFYKEQALYCAGKQCEINKKEKIQKVSVLQIMVVIGFILYVALTILLFNNHLHEQPRNLWQLLGWV